jgi:Nucleotidyl transferase AbiEii toxin, Type IV TA system
MPITNFQQQVFLVLKKSRNPDSYIAGGTAINRDSASPRFSQDIDIFHDTDEAVSLGYQADCQALASARYTVRPLIEQRGFFRAVVSKGNDAVKLEWVRDTAFRFFPVVDDPILGYRLHDADLAINKLIALANRSEIRDAIDLLHLHVSVLSAAACCWAACGKDPGFTPDLIFDMAQRHCTFTPDMLAAENLRSPLDPVQLKLDLLELFDTAKATVSRFPSGDLGCLYLDHDGNVVKDPRVEHVKTYRKHFGSVKGSWPTSC